MILVFIFLGLLILIFTIFLFLILSNLRIIIDNFKIENFKNNKKYRVYIQIFFLNKIKIFSYKIDSKKLKKISSYNRFKDINYKKIKNNLPQRKYLLKSLKLLKPHIEKFNLKIDLGLGDAPTNSYIIAIISSIISIILPKYVKNNKDYKNVRYVLNPVYNRNTLNITYESIINLKIVHIISMLFYLAKKGRDNYGRTSNRRTYGYSHEFN